MEDLHAHIARLENEIENLSDAAERCRKIDLLSRITLIAGGVWLIGELVGLVRSGPAALVIAGCAVLLGIVLYGSNRSTWQQISARLELLQGQRTSLIDKIDPKPVTSS